MLHNEDLYRLFVPGKERPTRDDVASISQELNVLPIPWVDPVDISNAVVFLVSEAGRYITGTSLPVDARALLK
jgi:(+)-trans-carveol dehydrogenase